MSFAFLASLPPSRFATRRVAETIWALEARTSRRSFAGYCWPIGQVCNQILKKTAGQLGPCSGPFGADVNQGPARAGFICQRRLWPGDYEQVRDRHQRPVEIPNRRQYLLLWVRYELGDGRGDREERSKVSNSASNKTCAKLWGRNGR